MRAQVHLRNKGPESTGQGTSAELKARYRISKVLDLNDSGGPVTVQRTSRLTASRFKNVELEALCLHFSGLGHKNRELPLEEYRTWETSQDEAREHPKESCRRSRYPT